MTYQDFLSDTIATLSTMLPKEADIRSEAVTKNNGYKPVALVISEPNTNIFPTIYMDEYYQLVCTGEDIPSVSKKILDKYQKYKVNSIMDISFFADYEKVKDIIVFRLVNYAKNEEFLSKVPHIRFLDLAIIFAIALKSNDKVCATSIIYNEHISTWNVDADTLYDLAKNNTRHILGFKLSPMSEVLNSLCGQPFIDEQPPEKLMYVLTNRYGTNGACSILYQEEIRDFAKKYNRDVYILPSSVHEVMLLYDDENMNMYELSELVKEVNDTQLAGDDILSDHAYKYILEEDRIV